MKLPTVKYPPGEVTLRDSLRVLMASLDVGQAQQFSINRIRSGVGVKDTETLSLNHQVGGDT